MERARLLSERWDAPCIVTTSVGFFQPLFSAKPADCRHLHQLANSVLVLDEAQSLPPHLLDATLRTVKLLCTQYGCTVVFSTATQPSFGYRPGLSWQPREIAPDPAALFAATRRVTEGLCVQCMHVGPYDAEPETIAAMHAFAAKEGYEIDISDTRYHHEIYLSDARRVSPEKLKTVIRHPIRKKP